MQYRVYDRQTLRYKDGGYVASYTIDDDYIVNNNSTITVVPHNTTTDVYTRTYTEMVDVLHDDKLDRYYVDKTYYYQGSKTDGVSYISDVKIIRGEARVIDIKNDTYTIRILSKYPSTSVTIGVMETITKTNGEINDTLINVLTGDVVALIEDSGAFHKGVITSVDPTALSISYKSDKELFNDNVLNIMREKFAEDEDLQIAGKFGVDVVIAKLKAWFVDTDDVYKRIPCVFQSDGDVVDENGEPKILWTWSNDSINIVDWLTELFEKYNLVLSWNIDFDIAQNDLSKRQAKYVVTLSALTNSGGIIKDNVDMQTITYTAKELPSATVAYVIDSETKEIIQESSGRNIIDPSKSTEHSLLDAKNNFYTGSVIIGGEKIDTENSSVTAYIRITPYRKEQDVHYRFSLFGTSSQIANKSDRAVCFYDKNKKFIFSAVYAPRIDTYTGSYNFSPSYLFDNRAAMFTNYANENGSIKLEDGETEEQAKKRILELVKYIRICYPAGVLVQLEEGETASAYDSFNQPAIYYLFERNDEYEIFRKNQTHDDDWERMLPVKTIVISYNSSSDTSNETTPYDVAKEKLVPSKFNQAIEIRIASDSKMFDFQNALFGDQYKIINERGTIDSVYTGKKITNKERWTTLYFGLGRQHYTDIMQIRLRRRLYNEVYNQ